MIGKTLKQYPTYIITNDGKVYSKYKKGYKTLRINNDGYLCTNMYGLKKKKIEMVHRLVAKAYIPNPHNKRTVNHKDGDKLNNNVDNLEWATDEENIEHAIIMGLNNCTPDDVVIEVLTSKETGRQIANRLGLNESVVSHIRTGRTRKHLYEKYYTGEYKRWSRTP